MLTPMQIPTVMAKPAGPPAKGWVGTALAVFYIFLWASAYVPSKVASTQSPPLWFLAARFLAAGLVLVGIAVARRRPWPERVSDWAFAASLGLFGNALYLGLTYTALHRLSAGMGAIIASTNPLLLALVAPYFLKERLSLTKLAGLVIGFGGVLAIVLARAGSTTALPPDVALAFGGVMANVCSTLLFKRYAVRFDLMAVTALQMSSAGLCMAVTAACVEPLRVAVTPELLLAFAYLVLVLSVGASLLWFWLLSHGEASRISAYYYLTPAFGLALSACLLHEAIGPGDWAGLAAIVFGIVLVQQRPRGSNASTAE
ncbi:MAG: DMT family transporter [Acetobacteraceae bacterium]|nr:DMT family transporter [Acetobacteraceae bacterium]